MTKNNEDKENLLRGLDKLDELVCDLIDKDNMSDLDKLIGSLIGEEPEDES